jgi:gliding motility-associated transport system permease protein
MILTIAHKELKSLFTSSLAWILLALTQLVLAWIFLGHLDAFLKIQPQLIQLANPPGLTEIIITPLFATAAMILLMATPLFTMRLIAEERHNHTMTFLISAPISMTDIVIGKFLGIMIFFSVIIALVITLSISLLAGGTLDFGLLLSNVVGLFMITACFASLGLYISCLTAQPAIAAAATLGALLSLWALDINDTSGIAQSFSILKHYESFNRGIIDTFDLLYFVLFAFTFLVLSIRRLDGERLRG